MIVRQSFDWFNLFTQKELSWLDDVAPEHTKKNEKEDGLEDVPLVETKRVSKNPMIISSEIQKTDLYKSIEAHNKPRSSHAEVQFKVE